MPFASAIVDALFAVATHRAHDLSGRGFLASCVNCLVVGLSLLAVSSAGASADNAAAAQAVAMRGVALLLTASSYDNNPSDGHAGCRASKRLILDRLRREAYDVVDASDLARSEIVNAITTFSDKRRILPAARSFVYVCGYAASVNRRVFYLPASQPTTGALRPETDGLLVKHLVELADGKSGIFIADLDPLPSSFTLPVDVGTFRQGGASGGRVDILVHENRPIGALGRDYGSDVDPRFGTLEEARSVALLRDAMIGAPVTRPLQPLPALALRAASAPMMGDPSTRPSPETPRNADKAASSASPMSDQQASVALRQGIAAAPAVTSRESRNRPRRAPVAPSVASAKSVVRAAVHHPSPPVSHLAASRQLAARRALYRRQLALDRARTAPGLLDMLLGTPRPPPRRAARLSQQLR